MNKKSLVGYYDKKYLLNVCGGGEEFIKGNAHQRFYRAIDLANIKKGDIVLDVGGGRGEIAILLSGINIKNTIIDYSKAAIDLVNEALKSTPNRKLVTTEVMDVMKLRYVNDYFDKIFFLEVLEHLTPNEANKAIKEMLRVLKPGGSLIISTSPNKLMTNILLAVARILKPDMQWKSRAYHINEQTYFTLTKTLMRFGFPYKIYCREDKGFFYKQIAKNQQISGRVKITVRCFNQMYDFILFRMIRKLPILNKIFCTSYLIEVSKS